MMDVSAAISRFSKPATLVVKTGEYNDVGDFVEGPVSVSPIQAAIFQITGSELKDLPEGIRSEASSVCWTTSAIKEGNEITQNGELYRVLRDQDRKEGGFHRAVLGRKEAA